MNYSQYSKKTQKIVDELRIIDDALVRLVAEDKEVCQEILQTLLDKPELRVLKVTAQSLVQSINREVVLDALCETDKGILCNIEMQKGNSNNDVFRTRFHASAITSKYTPKGVDFENLPKVTILYITEYDALKNGQTVTHVSRCMKNGNEYIPVNDGEDIVFANTVINDGSNKAELLQLMLNKDTFYNEKFPAMSNAIKYFKESEGGRLRMCKSVEDYAQEVAKETRTLMLKDFLANGGSEEDAIRMLGASEEEIKSAKE